MSPGRYVLYTGAGFAGLATILCFFAKLPKVVSYTLWALAMILLIVGAFLDKGENFCCGQSDYEHIFATPLNQVRDPDQDNPEKDYREKIEDAYKYRNNIRARRNAISQQYRHSY